MEPLMPAERYMYPGLVVTTHWVRPHYITLQYGGITYLLTYLYVYFMYSMGDYRV